MFDGNLIFRSRESFAIIALEYLTQLSQPVEEAYVMSEALSPSVIESLREFDSATKRMPSNILRHATGLPVTLLAI